MAPPLASRNLRTGVSICSLNSSWEICSEARGLRGGMLAVGIFRLAAYYWPTETLSGTRSLTRMRTRSCSGTDCENAAAAKPSAQSRPISALPFEDGLAELQVLAAAQGFGDAFGFPERALPPAIGGAAGGEAGGPRGRHTALDYVAAEHAAAADHLNRGRGLGGEQGFD